MSVTRKCLLAPATWAALLFGSISVGCQSETYRVEGPRPGFREASAQTRLADEKPGDDRLTFLPASYGQPGDPPPTPPAVPGKLAAGTAVSGIPASAVPHVVVQPPPTEKVPTAHAAYVIEPPDILMIQPIRMIPKPPYKVEPLDIVQIQVVEALPTQPINGPFIVSPEGMINLGFGYGVVRVSGLTIEQTALALKHQLEHSIRNPQVSVSLLQFRGVQQTQGEHLVIQDGTITLGSYGSVFVTGMTLAQAKAEIERHLSNFLLNPEISLSVNAYNSKVYYVITDGAGFGQSVHRLPITGKEFVLDAIALNGGLSAVSSHKKIWLARPGPPGAPCYKILPIDWDAITQGGDTTTNYQIFPGDRIFVRADPLIWINNTLSKILAPVEQLFGVTLLGATTVETLNGNVFGNNNNNGFR